MFLLAFSRRLSPLRPRRPCAAATVKPEKPTLNLAVGTKTLIAYLPLTIAERLGYFKKEGLDVEISDFGGGAKALQALVGGSARCGVRSL